MRQERGTLLQLEIRLLIFKHIYTKTEQRYENKEQHINQRFAVIHICKPHKPPHSPKHAKEYDCPNPRKISKYFFSPSKKIKTPDTQASQKSTREMTETDDMKMVVTHDRQERQPITAPSRNWRFSATYDSFVVQTFVLRMNICGENRQLLVAANRCAPTFFKACCWTNLLKFET